MTPVQYRTLEQLFRERVARHDTFALESEQKELEMQAKLQSIKLSFLSDQLYSGS